MLATEQEMKFEPIHPENDRYDFAAADWTVALAERYQMAVRGHTLVWHNTLPNWLLTGQWTRDELSGILKDHVQTVVGRYRGRVLAWDVVNEAIADDGTLRDCIWLQGIGPEYIEMAFHWAHEADPNALLFYNEGGGEGLGPKSDAIYALVKGLQERGVPIDGVGLEMHVRIDAPPDPAAVAENLARYAELGLQVQITEMDVFIDLPVTAEKLDRQALVFSQMLETCLAAPNCTAFVVWGFSDRQSWVPYYFAEYDAATLFNQAYRPKPAYEALRAALRELPGP
jgi:endo-1,4-beta-xylanase